MRSESGATPPLHAGNASISSLGDSLSWVDERTAAASCRTPQFFLFKILVPGKKLSTVKLVQARG